MGRPAGFAAPARSTPGPRASAGRVRHWAEASGSCATGNHGAGCRHPNPCILRRCRRSTSGLCHRHPGHRWITRSAIPTAQRSPTRPTATTPTSVLANPVRRCSPARPSETTSQAASSKVNWKRRMPSRRGAIMCRRMPARSAKTTAQPCASARSARTTAAAKRSGTRSAGMPARLRSVPHRPSTHPSVGGTSTRKPG